jgi:hypothetical protein
MVRSWLAVLVGGGDEVLAERSPAEKVDAVRLARFYAWPV